MPVLGYEFGVWSSTGLVDYRISLEKSVTVIYGGCRCPKVGRKWGQGHLLSLSVPEISLKS